MRAAIASATCLRNLSRSLISASSSSAEPVSITSCRSPIEPDEEPHLVRATSLPDADVSPLSAVVQGLVSSAGPGPRTLPVIRGRWCSRSPARRSRRSCQRVRCRCSCANTRGASVAGPERTIRAQAPRQRGAYAGDMTAARSFELPPHSGAPRRRLTPRSMARWCT